ncbi:MAG: TetR/AcrR family transcriptional regulator [Actinomycetota bacterium]
MTTRAEQRTQTRTRIVEAAIGAFAERGYEGAATRDIAARADTSQGLVSYHFESKVELWRAAADHLFGDVALSVGAVDDVPSPAAARETIRAFVRLNARRPELFHFMVDAGRHDDERMHYLVDTHLRRHFAQVAALATGDVDPAHVYYALAGSASLLFGVAPECRVLAGVDAGADDVVERHADYVARLFVPEPPLRN